MSTFAPVFVRPSISSGLFSLAALLFVASVSPAFSQDQDKDSAGIVVSGKASSKDVGLPVYPGSKPAQDDPNESQAARLGLWGLGSGFKMAVLKMESTDSVEKVAAFYKKALAQYGKVLDCSNATPDSDKKDSASLTCGDDHPNKGAMLFKSGTKEKQHIVAIQPSGKGSLYQLVALNSWDSDSKH
jgi:hypothetical protein